MLSGPWKQRQHLQRWHKLLLFAVFVLVIVWNDHHHQVKLVSGFCCIKTAIDTKTSGRRRDRHGQSKQAHIGPWKDMHPYHHHSNTCTSNSNSLLHGRDNDRDDDDHQKDENSVSSPTIMNATSPNTPPPPHPTKSLLELLSPVPSCRVDQMSGTELAYIGDVVFELFVRSRHVWPSKRTSDLQHQVVNVVRAEHQSYLLSQLWKKNGHDEEPEEDSSSSSSSSTSSSPSSSSPSSFALSTKELQVVMRGRNSVTKSSKNRRNPASYQDSTALEALIGYLYIRDPDRCAQLLAWFEPMVDEGTEDVP